MNDTITSKTPEPVESASTKSIQAYIDERPIWADGTAVGMTPMTAMQWRILSLAAAGKFFEGFVVFMTGVALPLIAVEYNISAAQHGLVSAASPRRHPDRRALPGRARRPVRPQADVHRRDVHLRCILVPAGRNPAVRHQLVRAAGVLSVRHRRRARLRLSDRAPDHLGERPEHRSRPPGAGRVRVPGTRAR
jgi:hypothetical protein